MKYQFIDRLKYLDYLIYNMNTSDRTSLAQRMKISKSCLQNYLSFMKQYGAPIIYCRTTKSYKYSEADYRFTMRFTKEI